MGAVSHGGTDARGFDKEFTRWTVPNVETLSGDKTIKSTDARVQLLNPGAVTTRNITLDASLHVIGTRITIRNTEGWNGSALNYGSLRVLNSAAADVGYSYLAYGQGVDLVYVGAGTTTGWQVITQELMASNGSGAAYASFTYFSPTPSFYTTTTQVGIGASPSSLFHVTASGDANALRVDNTTGYIGMGSSGNASGGAKLEVVTGITSRCGVHITDNKTLNTNKVGGVTFGNYASTNWGFTGLAAYAYVNGNSLSIGGNGDHYACTQGVLLAAANTTTAVGTVRAAWDINGFIVGDSTSPSSLFHVTASGNANALRVDNTTGQVLVGASAAITSASAVFGSATGAIVLNRWTTTERDALTATKGMMGYNTTTDKAQIYNGAWVDLH